MTVEGEETKDSEPIAPREEGKNDGCKFPDEFYCLITKKILNDPVVTPDGDSYEQSTIKAGGDIIPNKLYPNRALKSIIYETVELCGESLQSGFKHLQHSMWQNFSQLVERSAIPSAENRSLPDSYYFPITFNFIHDPAIDAEGDTFEHVAIENWIRAKICIQIMP
jgi:hypothetical protein